MLRAMSVASLHAALLSHSGTGLPRRVRGSRPLLRFTDPSIIYQCIVIAEQHNQALHCGARFHFHVTSSATHYLIFNCNCSPVRISSMQATSDSTPPASAQGRGKVGVRKRVSFTGTVFVKAGDGNSVVFADRRIMGQNSGALFRTLANDEVYHVELKDVPLSKCRVFVAASTNDEPTANEWKAAVELKGIKTPQGCVDELEDEGLLPTGASVFIHVQVPGPPSAVVRPTAGVQGECESSAIEHRRAQHHAKDAQTPCHVPPRCPHSSRHLCAFYRSCRPGNSDRGW